KYASPAMKLNYIPWNITLNNLEIRHANTAVEVDNGTTYSSSFSNARIIYCTTGFVCSVPSNSVNVNSACFNGVTTQYSSGYPPNSHPNDTTCSNNAPTLNDITDQIGVEDHGTVINFVCNDVETPGS